MIHILVFLIKAIVKAINANAVPAKNTYAANTNQAAVQQPAKVYQRTVVTPSDNRGLAVVLAIVTSICCSLNFLSNFILAIVLRKAVHIILSLVIAIGVISLAYNMDKQKKQGLALLETIQFGDTLHLTLSNEVHVKLELTNYLEEKYKPWIKDANFSHEDKRKINESIELMVDNLYFYTFDEMNINSYTVESTSLYTEMTNDYADESSIEEELTPRTCSIYLADHVITDQLRFNNDKLRELVVTARMKANKSQYIFVGGIFALWFLAFLQALYLWIFFFKKRSQGDNSTTVSSNQSNSYNPEVTINSQVAKAKKVEASTHPTAHKEVNKETKPTDRLDMNTIDIYQFLAVPSITYSQALLIIAERTNNGKYLNLEDLRLRNKLDQKIVDALAGRIYFS